MPDETGTQGNQPMNASTTNTPASDAQLLEEVLRHALDGVAVVESRDGSLVVTYANATLAALMRRAAARASPARPGRCRRPAWEG